MKKYYILLAVVAGLAVSCSDKNDYSPVKVDEDMMSVTAQIAAVDGAQTKSMYEYDDDTRAYATYWNAGDSFLVTDGTGTSASFTTTAVAPCATATFTGSYSPKSATMYAVYPASAASVASGAFTVKVAAEQTVDKNGAYTEWAKNDVKFGTCSNAQDASPVFHFKNVLSQLEINLKLDASHQWLDDEYLDYMLVEAPAGTPLVGTFSVPFDGNASITPSSVSNSVKVKFPSKTKLSSSNTFTAMVAVAPCTLNGDLKVTIRTTKKRTVVRTLACSNLEVKRSSFNRINLTKINRVDPTQAPYYNRFDIPKNLRLYDVSQNGMQADGGEVTVEWDDDIFDTANNEGDRYYTAQIRDSKGNIQTACANFQCTSSGIYGYDEYVKPRLTVSLLGINSRYGVRVKLMWAPDEDYSEWFDFDTPDRYSHRVAQDFIYMLDFAEVPGYGVGDPVNRCVSTFRGADFCQFTKDAMGSGYDSWAERLLHNNAGVTATYRIGDTGAYLNSDSRGSWGSNDYVEKGYVENGYVFERPGYVQLGSNQNNGNIKFNINRGSTISSQNQISCIVEFDACVYNDASDGSVKVQLDGEYKYGITYNPSSSTTVSIPANSRNHKFVHYTATVTIKKGSAVIGKPNWSNVWLTISNTNNHRILIDNIKVKKNW